MLDRRHGAWAVGLAALIAGVVLSVDTPELTLHNTGIRIEYGIRPVAGTLLAGAGTALLAATARRLALRILWGALAVFLLGVCAEVLRYRVDADGEGLSSQGMLSSTRIPWAAVTQVERGRDVLVVWGGEERQIRVATSDFRPEQRASLERTIARRVRESAPKAQPR